MYKVLFLIVGVWFVVLLLYTLLVFLIITYFCIFSSVGKEQQFSKLRVIGSNPLKCNVFNDKF